MTFFHAESVMFMATRRIFFLYSYRSAIKSVTGHRKYIAVPNSCCKKNGYSISILAVSSVGEISPTVVNSRLDNVSITFRIDGPSSVDENTGLALWSREAIILGSSPLTERLNVCLTRLVEVAEQGLCECAEIV